MFFVFKNFFIFDGFLAAFAKRFKKLFYYYYLEIEVDETVAPVV